MQITVPFLSVIQSWSFLHDAIPSAPSRQQIIYRQDAFPYSAGTLNRFDVRVNGDLVTGDSLNWNSFSTLASVATALDGLDSRFSVALLPDPVAPIFEITSTPDGEVRYTGIRLEHYTAAENAVIRLPELTDGLVAASNHLVFDLFGDVSGSVDVPNPDFDTITGIASLAQALNLHPNFSVTSTSSEIEITLSPPQRFFFGALGSECDPGLRQWPGLGQ